MQRTKIAKSSVGRSTELLTDSQAALDVIHAADVPKRSRHVEIRLAWIREHLLRGRLKLRWLRGAENAADLYTKNLGTRLFQEHRTQLGFITHVEALYMLSQLQVSPEHKRMPGAASRAVNFNRSKRRAARRAARRQPRRSRRRDLF